MLAAAHRLRRSKDFAAAVRGGRRVARGSVVVHLTIPTIPHRPVTARSASGLPDSDPRAEGRAVAGEQQLQQYLDGEPARTMGASEPPVRAGFVVSKAVGGAVTRNTVRRRLRHLVAERVDQLPPGSTLVVRALPGAGTSTYQQLRADLAAAIETARAPRPRRTSRRPG